MALQCGQCGAGVQSANRVIACIIRIAFSSLSSFSIKALQNEDSMPMMSQFILPFILTGLSVLPDLALAGNATPETYLGSKHLVLEIRYCECEAVKPDSHPSVLLADFLRESSIVRVAVPAEDNGFVSSDYVTMGYKFSPIKDSSDTFSFNYTGTHTTSSGKSSGRGQLLLEKDKWVHLFGSHHESTSGALHSNVAVRLVEFDGS